MIVTRDADLERAANAAAWGGLLNTGQICISIERVYVEEPIYDEFVAKLTEQVETLRQGADGDAYSGRRRRDDLPGADRRSSPTTSRTRARRAPGSSPAASARTGPGDWYEPTVLADVDHSMKVMREETFGPVIAGDEGARRRARRSRLANDTTLRPRRLGVRGDADEGERIARRIEAGRGQRQRRAGQLLRARAADGRLEGLRDRLPPRRRGDPPVLPHRGDRHPAHADGRSRSPLWFPYSAAQARRRAPDLPLLNARGLRNRLGLRRRHS